MFAIESTWSGGVEECLPLAEYLLYSDEVVDTHRKGIVAAVRNAILQYESAEFAVLSELVGAHSFLADKVARAVADYVYFELCREVMWFPDGRPDDS